MQISYFHNLIIYIRLATFDYKILGLRIADKYIPWIIRSKWEKQEPVD